MHTHGSFSTKTCRASSLTPKKGIAFPLASLPPKPAHAHDGHVIGMVGFVALPGYANNFEENKQTKTNKTTRKKKKKPRVSITTTKTEKVFTLGFGSLYWDKNISWRTEQNFLFTSGLKNTPGVEFSYGKLHLDSLS